MLLYSQKNFNNKEIVIKSKFNLQIEIVIIITLSSRKSYPGNILSLPKTFYDTASRITEATGFKFGCLKASFTIQDLFSQLAKLCL